MSHNLLDTQLYELIGEAGFDRLVAGFYRHVPGDDILGPMYPKDDLSGAEKRLKGFLIQRFGGPDDYSLQRGHPRLRMRHVRFSVNQTARDRWVQLMELSISEAELPAEARKLLRAFFHDAATFLINS